MSSLEKSTSDAPWQLQAGKAHLSVSPITGCVDLAAPEVGLQQLCCDGTEVDGHILGVTAGDSSSRRQISDNEVFTRGEDLIATLKETEEQPYSFEVYWRVTTKQQIVVVDLLLSLETKLLESFPSVATHSEMAAAESLLVSPDGSSGDITYFKKLTIVQEASCLVLRPAGVDWSYVEMPHPEDMGKVNVTRPTDSRVAIQWNLAGSFLEKGVIRRLRVRGAMVPRKDDLQLANQLFNELVAETPPLTA